MLLLAASKSSQLGLGTDSKFIAPSLHLHDAALDGLQFQEQGNNVDSAKDSSNRRYFMNMEQSNEVSYKIHVSNFANLPPLKLASKYISDLTKVDSMTPSDIYSDEHINKSGAGLDHYFFDYEKGLGELSRFEKIKQLDLPNKFFEEYNSTECITKIGMFPEISRAWIIADNKLTLWNYKLPQSSFNESAQFFTIDQLKHSILTTKLVKPRPGVFVKEVNYLLIISTVTDIHIFLIQYNEAGNTLEVFNPNLSVSTQGLIVNNFAVHLKTNEIYFSGEGNGVNVWRLEYTNKSSFIKNKCDKTCLTKSGISSVLPISKISGFDFFSNDSSTNNANKPANQNSQELISQMVVDSDRDILYTLSNKSNIRVYKLSQGQEQFTQHNHISPSEIFKSIASLFVNSQNIKAFLKFRIMSITAVSSEESSNVQLIAVTNYGFRILFKLGSPATFSSYFLKSLGSSYNLKMSVVTVKFPPSRELPQVNPELDSFTRNKQYLSQMVSNQQQSTLLQNTKLGKVLSPGVFICVKRTKRSDKLFVSTSNYGILKKTNKVVEDAEFLNINDRSVDEASAIFIHDIVQLTPSMNATNTPNGYANILASQYTKAPLQFAVLTNFGISIYQYRTPDRILKASNEEVLEVFVSENGFEEACSSLLYLACSYGNSTELYKQQAKFYFATLGNNARLLEYTPTSGQSGEHNLPYNQMVNVAKAVESHPTVEQVVLSDRFYGTCMLISRIFRDYWNSKVFTPLPHIKSDANGRVELATVNDDNLLIKGLSINKKQIEFFIGSIIVLIEFFVESGNKIQGLNTPNYSSDPNKFAAEVCIRAEHIAFTSVLKSLGAIKEGLSFLMVLIEEMETNETNFNDIMKFLSLNIQVNLLQLTFKDLLMPGRDVRNLIKDLLSSIINKNILKGGSIDLIASSLQGRCGSFCSADDVYIFKAIENLNRAKNIGTRDNELKNKFLRNAVELFEKAYDSLTLENIENSINIMLDLEFYTGAVDLLLKLAQKIGSAPAVTQVKSELFNTDLQNLSNTKTKANENAKKKKQLYDMIFSILVRVDAKTIQVHETHNQLRINELVEIRDTAYQICFASKDRAFQYDFYQWFINQGAEERLLDINTPFILPFLEEKAQKDLTFSDLLWLYHAKRENYFAAGRILYSLAVSEFHLTLDRRVEYMSRANGFCNCTCPPNLRQKMIQLSTQLQELLDVASLQLDVLATIKNDSRISTENKKVAENALGYKVLGISELFNDYTDPLGYYSLSLFVFKISDYKNSDEILKRWTLLFEQLYHKFIKTDSRLRDALYVSIEKSFISIAPKLSSSDLIFPVDELIKIIAKNIHEAEAETKDPLQKPPQGYLIDLFTKSGVSYDKLYYVLKSLIEQNAYEVYPKFTDYLKSEMVYLIQDWYKTDKMLRELIPGDKIRGLTTYSLESDPIAGLESA